MFRIGDIVFARFEDYPFWPAEIIQAQPHHLRSLSLERIPSSERLTLFFNDNGNYVSTRVSDLRHFDDPRMRRRTHEYNGQYRTQLRKAFALASESYRNTSRAHSSTPDRKKRPEKTPSPSDHPTSPITGHSESLRTPLTKNNSHRSQRPTSPSPSSSPSHSQSLRQMRQPIPRKSLHRPRNMPLTSTHSPTPYARPEKPKQSDASPISIKLRLRIKSKRKVESSHQQSVPRRRRLSKSHSSTSCEDPLASTQSQSESDELQSHHRPRRRQNSQKEEIAPEKTNITRRRKRISRLMDRNSPRDDEQPRRHRAHDVTESKKISLSGLEARNDSSEEVRQMCTLDKSNIEQSHCEHMEKDRVSRIRKRTLNDSDAEAKQNRKKLRRESKRANIAQLQRSSEGDRKVKLGATGKSDGNHSSIDSDQTTELAKEKRPDNDAAQTLTGLYGQHTDDCFKVIEEMQMVIRRNHVELWRRGFKLATVKDILINEDDLVAACEDALRKAEGLLAMMKNEREGKAKLKEREARVGEACRALQEIYFDKDQVSLKKVGKRVVKVAKEMMGYSRKVSTELRDVVVLWADLTGDCENAANKNEKKVEGKKSCSREERMSKFDREAFFSALQLVLKEGEGVLKMKGEEDALFAQRLEREIRPTFENDRGGYYKASVGVIRGIRKALRNASLEKADEAGERGQVAAQLVATIGDSSRSKVRELVAMLRMI